MIARSHIVVISSKNLTHLLVSFLIVVLILLLLKTKRKTSATINDSSHRFGNGTPAVGSGSLAGEKGVRDRFSGSYGTPGHCNERGITGFSSGMKFEAIRKYSYQISDTVIYVNILY